MYDILLVEDNVEIQTLNRNLLSESGYRVRLAESITEARNSIAYSEPDMIVLDIMLPDGNGLDFLKNVRGENNDIPVLILSALGATEERVVGLRAGGDGYITKPYDNDELLAQIETLLRRANRGVIKLGPITINKDTWRAYIGDVDIHLSRTEFTLLLLLIKNENITVSAEYLYEGAWSSPLNNHAGALQFQISKLRNKIEPSGYAITTKRAKGYLFEKA